MVEEEMHASPHSHGMGTLYETMHARAMDPRVTPLDGPLLPLSPALDFIHRRIMPRIFKSPLARPFLRPVDAVKEGIFPDYYQVWTNAKLYNPSSHPIYEWATALEMEVSTWLRRLPREVSRDMRAVEEKNLKACSNILAEIRRGEKVLAEQLGLRQLERRLELGRFESVEEVAASFREKVGRAYREGRIDCNLISEVQHSFEVEFANRVYAWEEEVEEEDVLEEGVDEGELEHKRLLELLSMSRRLESDLGSLRFEREWNESENGLAFVSSGVENATSEESMDEETVEENKESSHFIVKSFQSNHICDSQFIVEP